MNFAKYLEQQSHEDRQAFIIHYSALSGKTRFIQRACQVISGLHFINWLEYILTKPNLASLEKIAPSQFEKEILEIEKSMGDEISAVIIDQGDCMFNTWDADEKQEFLHWLRVPLRTPGVVKRTFVFIIQTDGVISSATLTNTLNQSRILALNELDAL
jgi:hypothetical protein